MISFTTTSEDDDSRMLKFPAVKRKKLQGPRPAALKIGKCSDSSKIIKKPAIHQKRSPVVIYLVSPKIIHVRPEEFMGLVQRLTGNQAATSSSLSLSSNIECSENIQAAVVSDEVNFGHGHDDHHFIRQAHECVSSSSPSGLAAFSSLCIDICSNWDDF